MTGPPPGPNPWPIDAERPIAPRGPRALIRLARPKQWTKTAFVLVGPFYALQNPPDWNIPTAALSVLLTCIAFSLASSACYVLNDLADAQADRAHPRKRHRPIASGAVTPKTARAYALALLLLASAAALGVAWPLHGTWWVLGLMGLHVINVSAYSAGLKRLAILDVISLALGFVIRVLAGCVAVGIWPSTWLLNVSLFLSMTLAFGKRMGERRTLGSAEAAAAARAVQTSYSDDLLRMSLVVTGVATLLTYAGYVVTREDTYQIAGSGFNPLWLTMLPAMYGLLRAIMLLENGSYDDPTELATRDRPFQAAALLFVLITGGLVGLRIIGEVGAT